MKIAFIGRPNKGSWQIRAVQMALRLRKMGLTVDCFDVRQVPIPRGYDRLIYVKRGLPQVWPDHCKVFWDPVDFWRQPEQDSFDQAQSISLANSMVPPYVSVIGATRRMGADLDCDFLYHHHRLDLRPAPLRDHVRIPVVAYEGNLRYLGRYRAELERHCKFVYTGELYKADAVLAVRDDPFKGYMSRCWKSNVKAANALAVGRIVITDAESGCWETLPTAMRLNVRDPKDIKWAVSQLTINRVRKDAFDAAVIVAHKYSINNVATKLLEVIR